jgi:hypothetical protein
MRNLTWSILISTLVTGILLLPGCGGGAPPPTAYPTYTAYPTHTPYPTYTAVMVPTATSEATSTPDPCTGWRCTVKGVVYSETADSGDELQGAIVTLHQTSYCSPTRGQHRVTAGPDGRFEFSDVFFHDTDRIRIQVESEGYESAQWDSGDFNCLYCSCFGSPLEIVLHATPGP